jgi:hypothetical protein
VLKPLLNFQLHAPAFLPLRKDLKWSLKKDGWDEPQSSNERDKVDSIPLQKSNPCLSAVSAATLKHIRNYKEAVR